MEIKVKTCSRCGEIKPLDEFYKDKRAKDERQSACKKCICESQKKWRMENPERYAEIKDNGREKRNKATREWYKRNRKHCNEQSRLWRENNKERNDELRRSTVERNKQKMNELKSKMKCVSCGDERRGCLQFHHVEPSSKSFQVTTNKMGSPDLANELSKCVCLCANCHALYHYEYGTKGERINKQTLEEFLGKSVDNLYCKV